MSDAAIPSIDFVRELRLRQWARQHWICQAARKATWHPIVLNEMSQRDHELANSRIANNVLNAPVSTISNEAVCDFHYLESGHVSVNIGATYVPLAPTSNYELHGGVSEIPRPHYLRVKTESRENAQFGVR